MAESKPVEAGKKSSKKLILIILLIQTLFVGAGAAYYFLIYKPEHSEQAHADGEVSAKKNSAEKEVAEPDLYYEIADPLLVNFPPGSSAKIIKVAVTILVQGEASLEVLKKHEPMIRNNLLMIISSIGAERMKTLEGKQELQAAMLAEVGKVMEKMAGKNTAKGVYFTEFVMQ